MTVNKHIKVKNPRRPLYSMTYEDMAQVHRIGPNFQEPPINQPVCPFHNNQRRGPMRHRIDVDQVNYHRNSFADNTPHETSPEEGGYEHYQKKSTAIQSEHGVNRLTTTTLKQESSGTACLLLRTSTRPKHLRISSGKS